MGIKTTNNYAHEMTAAATTTKKSNAGFVYFKLALFGGIFIASSYIIKQASYYQIRETRSYFDFGRKPQKSSLDAFICLLKQNFNIAPLSITDWSIFIFRIIFSSFLKDAIISVCSPSQFITPIPETLMNIVEGETLHHSWIPVTEAEWKRKQENGEADDERTHSFVYSFGHSVIEATSKTTTTIGNLSIKILEAIQKMIAAVIRVNVGIVCFMIRSVVCTVSSMLLINLYTIQLCLRTIKQVYNVFQSGLMYACTVTNDMALLSVQMIQKSVFIQNEDIFLTLKSSVENEVGLSKDIEETNFVTSQNSNEKHELNESNKSDS